MDFITDSGYRFTFVQETDHDDNHPNWVFLPGGPGLGSEYYMDLIKLLDLPGKIWRLDFPGDGSNIDLPTVDYNRWASDFIPAIAHLKRVVLVTHSFSGMFTLSIPRLEDCLDGYILMDTAPDREWLSNHAHFDEAEKAYKQNPNDDTFRALVIARWNEFMNESSKDKAIALLSSLPIHRKAYEWARAVFHPHYEAKWVPQHIPTLILSGEDDKLTPLKYFADKPSFHRPNITLTEISGASHFPWVEKPQAVKKIYDDYVKTHFL